MDNKRKKTILRYVFLISLMIITVYIVFKVVDMS